MYIRAHIDARRSVPIAPPPPRFYPFRIIYVLPPHPCTTLFYAADSYILPEILIIFFFFLPRSKLVRETNGVGKKWRKKISVCIRNGRMRGRARVCVYIEHVRKKERKTFVSSPRACIIYVEKKCRKKKRNENFWKRYVPKRRAPLTWDVKLCQELSRNYNPTPRGLIRHILLCTKRDGSVIFFQWALDNGYINNLITYECISPKMRIISIDTS